MKKTFVPLSVIKQKARQLKKTKALDHHPALDESARSFGFSNFRNYKNLAEENRKKAKHSQLGILETLSSERGAKVFKFADRAEIEMRRHQDSLKDVFKRLHAAREKRKSVQPVCRGNAALKGFVESNLLLDFLRDEGCDLESEAPYHVAKEVAVRNLSFRFTKGALEISGEYELKLEFAYEYDPNEKNEIFDIIELSGSFEAVVDDSLQMTIGDQDIELSW